MKTLAALTIVALSLAVLPQGGTEGGSYPFAEVDTSFATETLIVADGFTYQVLFREDDPVRTQGGNVGPAKRNHDFLAYLPIEEASDNGYLVVNHETIGPDSILGDGGDVTYFEVRRDGATWGVVGEYHDVAFENVGNTYYNCAGTVTPFGTILSAEEFAPLSNTELLSKGYPDTTDWTLPSGETIRRFENVGYMVEVIPGTWETRKLYQMGRYTHEGAVVMTDGRTVYLTDDFDPCVFFKFVADAAGDLSNGQLYAYRQSDDGGSGSWIELPMDLASLIDIRNVAMTMGATIFQRHEWVVAIGDKLYISETGRDTFDWAPYVEMGATVAKYFRDAHNAGEHRYEDPYGRLLEFDPETNRMHSLLEGGVGEKDRAKHFACPDAMAPAYINDRWYLVICEDLTGYNLDRLPDHAEAARRMVNEVYWLDLSIESPTVDDLCRFAIAPAGSEPTGPAFSPDYTTLFLNIQHPSRTNPHPFDRATTVAITRHTGQ